jgi:protocatechuate 3,4-dioxygenase, beta subunit
MGAIDIPDNVSWKIFLAKETDEGETLIVSGTVFHADGKTPAPDVLIYFYHTDAEGIYGRRGEHRHGKYRGWLLTDTRGRYEFRTIKPASYPDSTVSSHIHMTVTGKNFREDWIDSILFEGDKFISQREREQAGRKGGFNPILKLEKDADGILRGARNIQLWQV